MRGRVALSPLLLSSSTLVMGAPQCRQASVVTQEVMAQIQPGLGRLQVREILGTPLLADPFHADRWDYAFTIRRQGEPAHRVPQGAAGESPPLEAGSR